MNFAKVPQHVLWFLLAVAVLDVDSGRTARAAPPVECLADFKRILHSAGAPSVDLRRFQTPVKQQGAGTDLDLSEYQFLNGMSPQSSTRNSETSHEAFGVVCGTQGCHRSSIWPDLHNLTRLDDPAVFPEGAGI